MDQTSGFEQMPQTIGRYEVQGSIGFGAMGAVYKAFDPRIKRALAIKTIRLDIPRQSPEYKTFIERFYHEARISGTLSHPNIVTLFDIGEERGIPYLAMEYVEGETLAALIDRGERFAPEKVIALVSQVASAIDYAHTKGVVHRDIKPSNLILHDGERVKVTDFGIAKMVDAEMTQQGQMLGTPSYMSPEQAMGEKVDGRTDIFSLGVCAFEMLSGEQPFPGANVTAILYKLVHADPIEPANLELRGLVPQKWHEVFRKVLAKKADERYQTAADFVRDLEYCLGSWFGAAVADETLAEPPAPVEADETAKAAPIVDATLPVGEGARPAAPADASPTATLPPTPASPTPPVVVPDEATVKLDGPPPPGATIMLQAPVAPTAGSTVMLPPAPAAPPAGATVMLAPGAAPQSPPPPQAPPAPAEGATVLMHAAEVAPTVRAPLPELAQATVRAEKPSAPVATDRMPQGAAPRTPAPAPVAKPAPRPRPASSGGRSALVLGGLALVALLLVLGGGYFMLRERGEPSPAPSPVTEASVAPPSASPPPVVTGTLVIDSEPTGASVSVNGVPRGVTPVRLEGLALGDYAIALERTGFQTFAQTVTLAMATPEAELKPVLRPAGPIPPTQATLSVLSTPSGATVSVDGTPRGQTPLTNLRLRPGAHTIELRKAGFAPWSQEVQALAGEHPKVDVNLRALPPAATPTPPPATPDPERVWTNTAADVDVPARKTGGAATSYPDRGPRLRSGEQISVHVSFVVDEQGRVADVTVVQSGGKILDEAVVSAVKTWTYTPAVKRGVKVKVRIEQKLTFRAG